MRTLCACAATVSPYSREEFEIGLHSIAVPLAWIDPTARSR